MSRIGNKPITVPEGVEVTLDGQKITVKGPKGTLTQDYDAANISINVEGTVATVVRANDEAEVRSKHGLYRALLNNVETKAVFEKSEVKVWECRNCGHLVVGKNAPDVCPTCNHPQSYFEVHAENY